MNKSESAQESTGDSIGRPEEWQEGRYERPGDEKQESVVRKPGEDFDPTDKQSTPVTQEDYTGVEHNTDD